MDSATSSKLRYLRAVALLPCSIFSGLHYDDCISIQNSNLNLDEKQYLVSNMIYDNNYQPNFEKITEWNKKIKITPDTTQNKGVIKNAWIKILSIAPSVKYNNTLLTPNNVQALIRYNYTIQRPQDYQSSKYPQTNNGYCKISYTTTSNSALKQYVNNKQQNNNLTINQDSNIKAELTINAQTKIYYYTWKRYCTSNGCKNQCQLKTTSNINDKLILTDNINVKYYNKELKAEITPIEWYNQNTKYYINFTDSITIKYPQSKYTYYKYYYDVEINKYNILQLTVKDIKEEQQDNLQRINNNLIIKDTSQCTCTVWNHFQTKTEQCINNSNQSELELKTNKFFYQPNETIIAITNKEATITYSNQTAKGTVTTFKAEPNQNKIIAKYKNKETDILIQVINPDYQLIPNIIGTGLILCFFYSLIKKLNPLKKIM